MTKGRPTNRRPTAPARRSTKSPGHPHRNIIGPTVAKLRNGRGWTREQLVAKLQIAGYPITHAILLNIELRRTGTKDFYAEAFAIVFKVGIDAVFPPPQRRPLLELDSSMRTRRRRRSRRPARRRRNRRKVAKPRRA